AALHQSGLVSGGDWRELPRLVRELGNTDGEQVGNKYTLFDEVVNYMRLATAARPLVVVLDDIQWADLASWDVLEHLLAHLDQERLLICLTMRSEDLRGHVLERRHRLLRDERFHEFPLARLTESEIRVWLTGVLGGQEASKELLGFLHRNSEGNPLLATQLVRMLL